MQQNISHKLIHFCLIVCSLVGYMEWGTNQSMFVIQGEIEIFSKIFTDPMSVFHPFIILPFFGQVVLIITLFQRQPRRLYSLIGFGCIALLLVFLLFIGLISLNIKIIGSTLPFMLVSILFVKQQWNLRKI